MKNKIRVTGTAEYEVGGSMKSMAAITVCLLTYTERKVRGVSSKMWRGTF